MSIEEAIRHCEEVAEEQDKSCKRYDDASGYTRSHNEEIRTSNAKRCEECAAEYRQLAEWLRDYKRLKERESEESKYKRAFKVACELLNDDYLYGYDWERIYTEVMQAEGVFSSEDYEQFILEHLDRLSGEEGSGKE